MPSKKQEYFSAVKEQNMLTLSSMAYETLWLLRGASEAPLKYQGRSLFRPHVTKSYFETYKSYDHMQKFRPKSQNLREQKNVITS